MSNEIAVKQKQINLFTSSDNVNFDVVEEVEKAIKLARKGIKVQPQTIFNADFTVVFDDIDLDTFMYLVEKHDFEKRFDKWESKQKGVFQINNCKGIFTNFYIQISSVKIEINVMPNNVKQEITT